MRREIIVDEGMRRNRGIKMLMRKGWLLSGMHLFSILEFRARYRE